MRNKKVPTYFSWCGAPRLVGRHLFVVFSVVFLSAALFLLPFTARAHLLVVLDPGHGGSDTGAIHRLGAQPVAEKDITLTLAHKTATALRARGIQVVLTRDHDSAVALDRRTAIANSAARHADTVLLSIHVNSARDPYSSGIETYVFNATNNEASRPLSEIENDSPRAEPKPYPLGSFSHGELLRIRLACMRPADPTGFWDEYCRKHITRQGRTPRAFLRAHGRTRSRRIDRGRIRK